MSQTLLHDSHLVCLQRRADPKLDQFLILILVRYGLELLYTVDVQLARKTLLILLLSAPALAGTPQSLPVLRWTEGAPGCALRFAEDGHTYYSVSTVDFQLTLAIDNQELEKIRHRSIPMIGVLLSFNYKGTKTQDISPSQSTLEFSKHFQVVQRALDPETMLTQLQQNIDDLTDEVTRHQIKKHPEQKTTKEAELQQRLRDYTEMMDFISTHALHDKTLDSANSSASGWVFFNTKNRWIGPWRQPEQFVLRIPVNNALVEFPFELPPKQGKVQLRTRQPQ